MRSTSERPEWDGTNRKKNHFQLRSLFLQKNLIRSITGLGGLTHLVSLDLSENRIDHIGGLSSLNSLQTLNVAKNCLTDEASVVGLTECQSITNVDLSNNDLADESIIKNVLGEIGSLVACNLSGNSLNNKVGQFRKKCICAIKKVSERAFWKTSRRATTKLTYSTQFVFAPSSLGAAEIHGQACGRGREGSGGGVGGGRGGTGAEGEEGKAGKGKEQGQAEPPGLQGLAEGN